MDSSSTSPKLDAGIVENRSSSIEKKKEKEKERRRRKYRKKRPEFLREYDESREKERERKKGQLIGHKRGLETIMEASQETFISENEKENSKNDYKEIKPPPSKLRLSSF